MLRLATLAGAVLFVMGWSALRILAFPLGFLVLMIPIPAIIFNQIAFIDLTDRANLGASWLYGHEPPVVDVGKVEVSFHCGPGKHFDAPAFARRLGQYVDAFNCG